MKCRNCGNEKMSLYREKKTPVWAIICAIIFFPVGLFCLIAKQETNTFICHDCGYKFKEEI